MPVVAETAKPASSSSEGGDKHKHLDREVRDMVSTITSRLANIHKAGLGHGLEENDIEDSGVRIVTLAGTNTGANLRGELDDKSATTGDDKPLVGETEALRTYVNSNFQAVNNSIMMGGSYSANDPGVHVEIADDYYTEPKDKKVSWRKGKKKNKEGFKTDKSSLSSSTSGSESSD